MGHLGAKACLTVRDNPQTAGKLVGWLRADGVVPKLQP